MGLRDPNVAMTKDHLRDRVIRLVKESSRSQCEQDYPDLYENPYIVDDQRHISTPTASMSEFLGYVCDALPSGELYLFGGVLRDLAMFGQRGFASDFDLVVEGDWAHLTRYLERLGASRNRFGGYRLYVDGWPIDIWAARETWAIREGLVRYRSIESLTETTVFNWDAILLNWRSGEVICRPIYFSEVRQQLMDVVLTENPNPLGAAVRAFRHLCSDAERLTEAAARYLCDAARRHSAEAIVRAETASYRNRVIDPTVVRFFEQLDTNTASAMRFPFRNAQPYQSGHTPGHFQPLLIRSGSSRGWEAAPGSHTSRFGAFDHLLGQHRMHTDTTIEVLDNRRLRWLSGRRPLLEDIGSGMRLTIYAARREHRP